ncbi:MAG: hypothetical protein ACQEXJ_18695 [Myxococcota bacterium]
MRRLMPAAAVALALLAGPGSALAQEPPAAPPPSEEAPADEASTDPDWEAAEPESQPEDESEEPGWARPRVDRVGELLAHGEPGAAVVQCDELRAEAERSDRTPPLPAREACARAHLALADLLDDLGDVDEARANLHRAASWDPRLLDDPDFVDRMKHTRPRREVAPAPPPPRPRPTRRRPPPVSEPAPDSEPDRARSPGPRAGRTVGVGLSGGFDGLLGLAVGWMYEELLSVEVGVGVLHPVLDSRIRLYGMRHRLTPVVGLGMTTPLAASGRFGVDAGPYEELYDLGETVHVDVGLSWAPVGGLDLFAGLVFVTTVDQEHPDRLFFFPQVAAQALWYF